MLTASPEGGGISALCSGAVPAKANPTQTVNVQFQLYDALHSSTLGGGKQGSTTCT